MFKQIFNRPNRIIILSSNFKISKNPYFISYLNNENIIINNNGNHSLFSNVPFSRQLRFQNTLFNDFNQRQQQSSLETNPLNSETLLKDNTSVLDLNLKIFERSNLIASNESSNISPNLLNTKEIPDEKNPTEKDRDTLDNNQQVLEMSMSFANRETSLVNVSLLDQNNQINQNNQSNQVQINHNNHNIDTRLDDTSKIKEPEKSYHPFIQTEGRDIDDIWNDYKNLTQEQFKIMTIEDFNNIIGAFKKSLKSLNDPKSSLIHNRMLSIFGDLKRKAKLTPDASTYNILMSTALTLGDLSNLQDLFKTMKYQDMPNMVSYNIMMSGFVKSGFHQQAHALYKEMVNLGIKRTKFTYTIILSACAKDKHVVDALEYFKMMLDEGIKPDVQIYNTLLNVLIYDADRDHIIRTFEEMKAQGIKPTVLTYNNLIKAMNLRGEKDHAKKYFNEMESEGIKPNVSILDLMGFTGFEAIQKLQDPSGKDLNVLDYNTLLRGCLHKSEYNDAFKIFNIMQENEVNPSLITYTILMGAYLKVNETEKALELINKMKNDNVAPDSQIYTFMIDSLLNQKNIKKAFDLLSDITNSNDEIIFGKRQMIRLFDSASKLEDCNVIEELFHKILKTGSQLPTDVFEKILWHMTQGENYEKNISYYLKYMESNQILIQNTTYGAIIEGFIQKDDTKNSIYWYEHMIDDGFIPTGKVIFKMMQFFSKKKKTADTLKYWNDFYKFRIKPGKDEFNFIIEYCCSKSGNNYQISEVFSQCREMGLVPTNEILLKIMQFYSNRFQIMKVIKYWDIFYALGIKPRLDVIDFMVNFCCKLGDKKLIFQILSQCKDAGYDAFSLYKSKKSNKDEDDLGSFLFETSIDSREDSYEKNLEVIEHWINTKEKDTNALLNINKKLKVPAINRLRRVLDIEERALREQERLSYSLQRSKSRLDLSAQKGLQRWTPYKKIKNIQDSLNDLKKDDIKENVEKNVDSDVLLVSDEPFINSIIETTFQNLIEEVK